MSEEHDRLLALLELRVLAEVVRGGRGKLNTDVDDASNAVGYNRPSYHKPRYVMI